MNKVSRVFIGSSSQSLGLARELKKLLSDVAVADVWENAFRPGGMLLTEILKLVERYDFGVFVFAPDDVTRFRGRKKQLSATAMRTVRDNVLFETGVFMAALGPERTFIVTPPDARGRMRIPSDLQGLLTLTLSSRPQGERGTPRQDAAIKALRRAVSELGPALRSSYNEVLELEKALDQTEFKVAKKSYVVGELVRAAARSRKRPWTQLTDPADVIQPISQRHGPNVADYAYWWLVVRGVYQFRGVWQFAEADSWFWRDSVEYVVLSERGVVLLNQMRLRTTRRRIQGRK